jgi:hypothetical protein
LASPVDVYLRDKKKNCLHNIFSSYSQKYFSFHHSSWQMKQLKVMNSVRFEFELPPYLGSQTLCHQYSRGLRPKIMRCRGVSYPAEVLSSIPSKTRVSCPVQQLRLKFICEFESKFVSYSEVNSVLEWMKQSEAGDLLLLYFSKGANEC